MRIVAMLVVLAAVAHADPRVVIVETADAPKLPALATQVRVYAGRTVDVATIARPESSAAFAGSAATVVAQERATAVVWVAQVTGGYLVFAAGHWPDRALIELVHIAAETRAEEAERTIALKIGALLDSLLVQQPPVATLFGVPEVARPVERRAPVPRWWIDLAGSLVREQGDRAWDGRIAMHLGRRWSRGDVTIAVRGGAHWQPASVVEGMLGRIVVQEIGVDAGATIAKRYGRWSPFSGVRVTAAALHARGITNDGRASSTTELVPLAGVDVGVRWALSATTDLTFALETDVALIHQRFLLDGAVTADLQRLRVGLAAGVSIAF